MFHAKTVVIDRHCLHNKFHNIPSYSNLLTTTFTLKGENRFYATAMLLLYSNIFHSRKESPV